MNVSLSTIDRARRAGTLKWFRFNKRAVRIWEEDLYRWVGKGMPLLVLVLVLGYACLCAGKPGHHRRKQAHLYAVAVVSERPARAAARPRRLRPRATREKQSRRFQLRRGGKGRGPPDPWD